MLYDLDHSMDVQRRGGRRLLIATAEARDNLLRVMHTYAVDSAKDGYAHPEDKPGPVARARDRARAFQLWEHGILSQAALQRLFKVTRRTLSGYWGLGAEPEQRLWGSLYPEHIPYLLSVLDKRRAGEHIDLRTEVLPYFTAAPEPAQRSTPALVCNLLGLDTAGRHLRGAGMDEVPLPEGLVVVDIPPVDVGAPLQRPRPPMPPAQETSGKGRAIKEESALATDLSDPDVRESVERGEQAFAPALTDFDDSGDAALEEWGDLSDALQDVEEDTYEQEADESAAEATEAEANR